MNNKKTQNKVFQYGWVEMLTESFALMNSGEACKLYKAHKLLNVILGLPEDGTKDCRSAKRNAAVMLAHLYAVGMDASNFGDGEEFDPRWEVETDIERTRELLLLARKYGYRECESTCRNGYDDVPRGTPER